MKDKFNRNKTTSKTVSQTQTSTVINTDGEILSEQQDRTFKFVTDSEPPYIKFYLQDTEKYDCIKKGTEKLLKELFKYISYNDNRIYLNSTIRKDIADKLNIKEQTLSNGLNELKKHQLLIHLDKSVYMANTLYFGKGEWRMLKKHRNNIGIEDQVINLNGKPQEVTNFNFDKCGDEQTNIGRLITSRPKKPHGTKKLNTKQKTKLQKLFSLFKR